MGPDAPTIVIVDDAPEVRLLVRTHLRMAGALRVVGEGADGAEAVELALEHRPSLMLLDVSMPGTDGLEALPGVLAASPSTCVVLYTGFEEEGLMEKARQLGAAEYVEKSVPISKLNDRLLAVLPTVLPTVPPAQVEPVEPVEPPANVDRSVLDEHLERFREVFDQAAIGMATLTLAGNVVRANSALATLLQRPSEQLVGMFYGHLTDGQADRVTGALEDIRRQPLDVVQLEHGISGTADARLARATLAPVRDSAGQPLYVFLQVEEVTAQRAAIEELRKSEERFRLLVETVEDYAIFMLDPDGLIASWNAGAQRTKGYTADEIIGQHFRIFYPPEAKARKHPEHELQMALDAGHYEEEGWRIRKDGTRFWANVVITAVRNPAGEHIGFAKVTRDTSDRRRLEEERAHAVLSLAEANAELESLNERLQQAAADQSQFLAVTTHELRSPIGVLAGSADTLARHWTALDDEERSDLLAAMQSSTVRLRRLLEDLLTASRLEASVLEMHAEPFSVDSLVSGAAARIGQSHPEAQVEIDVPGDLAVLADRERVSQALDNLISNALRHGVPPVRVSAESNGDSVQIRVSDNGSGVTEAVHPRLFERFATGMNKGGTGLGLFIVRELARAQGGDAFYETSSSDSPAGTFVISLPAAAPR